MSMAMTVAAVRDGMAAVREEYRDRCLAAMRHKLDYARESLRRFGYMDDSEKRVLCAAIDAYAHVIATDEAYQIRREIAAEIIAMPGRNAA